MGLCESRGVHEIGPVVSERWPRHVHAHACTHMWREEILVHEIPDMEAVSPARRENKIAELFITGPAPQLTQQSQQSRSPHFFFLFLSLSLFVSFSLGASLIAQLSGSPSRRRRSVGEPISNESRLTNRRLFLP